MSLPSVRPEPFPPAARISTGAVQVNDCLSVIIPVYNESRWVLTLLEVVKQVPLMKEIIVARYLLS